VTRDGVLEAAKSQLKRDFGELLAIRELRKVRRVSGETWSARVVCILGEGEVPLGHFEVSDSGVVALSPDRLVESLRAIPRRGKSDHPVALAADDEVLSGSLLTDESPLSTEEVEDIWVAFDELADSPVEDPKTAAEIYDRAVQRGDRVSYRRARDQLPRLLADAETRGETLYYMAQIERRLDETALALGYVDAGSREYANRFDLEGLERCAALGRELLGDRFSDSSTARLLEQNRARLQPILELFDTPVLRGLPADQRAELAASAKLLTLQRGDYLVREGEPSRAVFVIKSGVLGVFLEDVNGARLVRCCHPGLLLGESSVLLENPRCSASLRAETSAEVWALEAGAVTRVMAACEILKRCLESTKYVHRIDSFFSMHESLGQLDPAVRDDILACLYSIEAVEKDTVLVRKDEVPSVICLVARGELALFDVAEPSAAAKPLGTVGTDAFFGFRDALHAIPSERTAVARAGATVVCFDASGLRTLCNRSQTNVSLVLERLG
jgi:hypothetical protein